MLEGSVSPGAAIEVVDCSTHPGEVLLEEFRAQMGLTQRELAEAIDVPY